MRLAIIDDLGDPECRTRVDQTLMELSGFVPGGLQMTWHAFPNVAQNPLPNGQRLWRTDELWKPPSGRSVTQFIIDGSLKPICANRLLGIDADHRVVLITCLPLTTGHDNGFTNYSHGQASDDNSCAVCSVHDVRRLSGNSLEAPYLFARIVAHELGHMLGLPGSDRTDIEENLGLHCINGICLMRQCLEFHELVEVVLAWRQGAPLLCASCQSDLRKNAGS